MTGVNLKCDDGGGQGNSRAESLGGINGINTHIYIYTHKCTHSCREAVQADTH